MATAGSGAQSNGRLHVGIAGKAGLAGRVASRRGRALAWAVVLGASAAVLGVGLIGSYRYVDNFWLYRGYAPPRDPAWVKQRGTAQTIEVRSAALGGRSQQVIVFLPPGYQRHPRRRYPVFYMQERVGLNNKKFRIIKFRSMRVDAEANGPVWANEGDLRVTRVGRWIRKRRVDELPQLFNVIRGEMSLIGPRPERPVFVNQLEQQIPYYSERHLVKPGLTGWAQVRYQYGASLEDAREKHQYDLYYIKHQAPMLDALILLETARIVLFGRFSR